MDIVTIILLLLLGVITLIFWIRSKVTALIASGIRLGFLLFLISAVIGILFPQPFNTAADFTLRQFGTYDKIHSLDETLPIHKLQNFSGNIIDQLQDLFSGNNNEEQNLNETGFFEANIYTSFVEILGFIFRMVTLIISFAVLIALIYVSFITTHITDIESLKQANDNLKKRVEDLEKRNTEVRLA